MTLKIPQLADGDVMLLQREIDEIPYLANTRQQITIRLRPNLIKNFILHLEAVCTANVALPGVLQEDFPWRLFRRITIFTPRGEVLKTVTGRQLHLLNNFEFGTTEYSTFANLLSTDPTTFHADLLIPFQNHTANIKAGVSPEASILNLNEFTELYVAIDWADGLEMFITNLDAIDVTCSLVALEREPLSTSDELEPRQKMVDQSFIYPINSDELQILLPENSKIKTVMFMVLVEDQGAYTRTDDLLERVRIVDDDNAHTLRSLTGTEIQSQNKSYYHVEPGYQAGLYVIEFDQLRDFKTLYNTAGLNYPKAIVNFNQTIAWDGTDLLGVLIRQITTPPALTI